MTSTRKWTVSECLEKIEALEAKSAALVDVPTKGRVGNTEVDLAQVPANIDRQLRLWRARLAAARSGDGLARRTRWGC
jgi:hypothetical protein